MRVGEHEIKVWQLALFYGNWHYKLVTKAAKFVDRREVSNEISPR